MAIENDKQVAKEILIKALEIGYVVREEFPDTDTAIDLICQAYEKIYDTVKKY